MSSVDVGQVARDIPDMKQARKEKAVAVGPQRRLYAILSRVMTSAIALIMTGRG